MLAIKLLSKPRVALDGEAVTGFVSDKALALVCYLALNEGMQSRETLAGLLWGEMSGERAKANLRVALHNLKKLLPGYFRVTRKRVAFAHKKPHRIDVSDFEKAADRQDPQSLEQAVALYEDDFLNGLHVDGAYELEAWLRTEQERLRLRLIDVLEYLGEGYSQRSQWGRATSMMRRLLAIEPWREGTHRQLMLLLARQGKYTAALAQYEQCRQILAEELAVAPMAETDALYERIRQLQKRPRHNLPEQPTKFLGRQKELIQLKELLTGSQARLVTIVGLGGVGKTRLAVEAAKKVAAQFLEGVIFVSLARTSSATYLASAIADAVGFQFTGERSQDKQLLDYLNEKELLLILDNYEHLLPETSLLVQLLEAAPNVKLLVTSRERLQLRWEWLVEVEGLTVEAQDSSTLAEGPQLFLFHARRLSPDFDPSPTELEVIENICRFVEGIPLAIEMAAAGTRLLPPSQLDERLRLSPDILTAPRRGVPRRHQSMYAVFDHSWRLLQPFERDVLARLSVFRASFNLAAAEAVAGATAPTFASLIDKSLLMRRGSERYEWHELLRQYATEKLKEWTGVAEESVERHYRHYVEFVEAVGVEGIFNPENLKRIEIEIDNIRQAWEAATDASDYEILNRLTPILGPLYFASDRSQEGEKIFGETIAHLRNALLNSDERAPTIHPLLAALLSYRALYILNVDLEESIRIAHEAVELFRPVGKPTELGQALMIRSDAVLQTGRTREAIADLEEALRIVPGEENRLLYLAILHRAALAHLQDGNYSKAETYGRQYLKAAREVSFDQSIAYGLRVLGNAARGQGKGNQAILHLKEALEVARRSGRQTVIADVLFDLSRLAYEQDQFERASEYLAEVEGMERLLRNFPSRKRDLTIEHSILTAGLGEVNEARRHFREALSLLRESQQWPQVLYLLLHVGLLFGSEQPEYAIEVVSMVQHHPASSALTAQRAEKGLKELRSKLPTNVVEAAIARGKELELEPTLKGLVSQRISPQIPAKKKPVITST